MEKLLVSPSPHIHSNVSTRSLMRDVVIALLPALVFSILIYGWAELLVVAVSVASCVLLEWVVTKWLLKRPSTIGDLSAVVTGILLAMNLPSSIPLGIVFVGAVIAICVAKLTFGGIGQNVFNPAITARVFLLISFPQQMTNWNPTPGFLHATDAISGATILGKYAEGGMQGLIDCGYTPGNLPFFFEIGGSAGEISGILLLLGFVYLLVRRVVKIWTPLSIFATVALISGIFCIADPSTYTGPLFNILTGGMILGACFMATDYVTSPMSRTGCIIYGFGIGFIVMMIRYFGAYPEGMSFAILIMNMAVPLINRKFHQKKYGRSN